jgi:hypothetical protein
VAPTNRSPKGMVTPWACCSPSIFPASKQSPLCPDRSSDRSAVHR